MTRVAVALRGFAAFWWDFIVGDDWRIAAAIVIAFAATAAVATTSFPAWWIVPLAVLITLALSLRSAARAARNN